jgi:RNA polymerase sigma-70 factor (ECF subfamily)
VAEPALLEPATVAAFRTGDVDALGQVYERYARPVWRVAMTVLRDRELADDATQETFIRAWRAADSFDPNRQFTPWLFTIARRAAIDVHRRESRPTLGGHEAEQDAVTDPPELTDAWESWQITLALDALPEEERVIVRLAHFDGLTHREIAEALHVPVGTVKSRSHRAHRRLAESLSHLRAGQPDEAMP